MRIIIRAFGKFFDLEIGTSNTPEPMTREQSIANHDNIASQVGFGFSKPLDYPDERWTST